jgi:hypothetical protein
VVRSVNSNMVTAYWLIGREGSQIFASKYLQFLPSERELRLEIEKERSAIEARFAEKGKDADEKTDVGK